MCFHDFTGFLQDSVKVSPVSRIINVPLVTQSHLFPVGIWIKKSKHHTTKSKGKRAHRHGPSSSLGLLLSCCGSIHVARSEHSLHRSYPVACSTIPVQTGIIELFDWHPAAACFSRRVTATCGGGFEVRDALLPCVGRRLVSIIGNKRERRT